MVLGGKAGEKVTREIRTGDGTSYPNTVPTVNSLKEENIQTVVEKVYLFIIYFIYLFIFIYFIYLLFLL